MLKISKTLFVLSLLSASLFAASDASFPKDWKSYVAQNTPLAVAAGGSLPDCNADVSGLPAIYQETVAMYCAVRPEGPGKTVSIVAPSAQPAYDKRDGSFKDGDFTILHLQDLKLLFVTEYKNGEPLYGVFTEDGKDVSGAPGSGLNPQDCKTCHTGYEAYCVNGQCGQVIK